MTIRTEGLTCMAIGTWLSVATIYGALRVRTTRLQDVWCACYVTVATASALVSWWQER